jgi:tripartite-type tricarboxylate transporter receptor subunit TctC
VPDLKAALAAQGFSPLVGSAEQFDAFYRSEVAKWRQVIEAVGIASE